MAAPRWLARFNRRFTNRVLGVVAPRAPGFGVIVHQGRRSGRLYRTPVNVFRTADGYMVALTYGAESDWVKNVLAAGGCELVNRGRTVRLRAPRVVQEEGQRQVPRPVGLFLRLLGVTEFLLLTATPAGGSAT